MWTLGFEFEGPQRVRNALTRQRSTPVSKITVPVVAVAAVAYAVYFMPASIDPGIDGLNTANPAVEVRGSAPPSARVVTILRNGYGLAVPVFNGRFVSLVPLLPGLNRIQAAVNGRVSAPVDVTGPTLPPPEVTRALAGDCTGTIAAYPTSGYVGENFLVVVNLDAAAAGVIARVTTDNPGCRSCDADRTAPNQFTRRLVYQGRGPFRITFLALDKEGKVRCEGVTTDLTSHGQR
jgi:hypothetical protein